MKLLVGLGNPEKTYVKNRHNVGFMFLDTMCKEWKAESKFYGEVGEAQINGEKMLLLKPSTFMNESGKAVAAVVKFYKINVRNIIVVHDDLDLAFGTYKMQRGRGPKVHNGLLSIEKSLGSVDFWRIRIGVDGRDDDKRIPGEVYVLQDFTQEEIVLLKSILPTVKTDVVHIMAK